MFPVSSHQCVVRVFCRSGDGGSRISDCPHPSLSAAPKRASFVSFLWPHRLQRVLLPLVDIFFSFFSSFSFPSALDFFEQFKSVCSKLSLQPSLLDLLKLLERKYVVSHLLFRKYEKLFNQIVDVSELRVNPVSRGDALKFGWLLFLVAKGRIIPDTIPDLASSLDVLICALSFTFSNWGAVNDPGVASLARHCGCDAEKVQVLKQVRIFLLFFFSFFLIYCFYSHCLILSSFRFFKTKSWRAKLFLHLMMEECQVVCQFQWL